MLNYLGSSLLAVGAEAASQAAGSDLYPERSVPEEPALKRDAGSPALSWELNPVRQAADPRSA